MSQQNDHGDGLDDDPEPIPPPPSPAEALEGNAPAIDLAADMPTFEVAYPPEHFATDEGSELVSIARLPPWPTEGGDPTPYYGHGLGDHLAGMLGVGLRPGEMLVLGAAAAGAGKTAFLMQLADGLALRNAQVLADDGRRGLPLTPVVVASEMSAQALTWRTLARWTGYSARYFRGGATMARHDPERARRAWAAGRSALERGELAVARRWMRLLDPTRATAALDTGVSTFVAYLVARVERWRDELCLAHPRRDVVPIIVVDPVQRYQGNEDAIAALNILARELCAASVARGWLTLLTSDTNKDAAKGKHAGGRDEEEGAGAFRGSYNLLHETTGALYLRRARLAEVSGDEERVGLRYVETVVVKSRWGGGSPPWPRFRWYGPTARLMPMTEEQTRKAAADEAERPREAKTNARNGGAAPGTHGANHTTETYDDDIDA